MAGVQCLCVETNDGEYGWAYECMHLVPTRHLGYALIRHVSGASVTPLGHTKALSQLCHLHKCTSTNK
jgi:hypothetical protein